MKKEIKVKPKSSKKEKTERKKLQEKQLDEALKETFPASDSTAKY